MCHAIWKWLAVVINDYFGRFEQRKRVAWLQKVISRSFPGCTSPSGYVFSSLRQAASICCTLGSALFTSAIVPFFCFPPCSSPHVRQTALPHRATVNRKTPSSKQFAMFVSTLALSRYIKSSEHGKVFVLKYHYLSISCFMFLLSSAQWGDTVIERLVCSAIRIFREMLAASFIGFSWFPLLGSLKS